MTKLTKSLFMSGQQCPRLLWYSYRKELPEITLSDKHKFAQDRNFEVYVKKLFPDGVDLKDLSKNNIRQITNQFFKKSFGYNNLVSE